MVNKLDKLSIFLAGFGILLCLASGLVRLSGQFYMLGFESMTVFNAGTTIMIAACLAKLFTMKPATL